jgi:hypothetical protein
LSERGRVSATKRGQDGRIRQRVLLRVVVELDVMASQRDAADVTPQQEAPPEVTRRATSLYFSRTTSLTSVVSILFSYCILLDGWNLGAKLYAAVSACLRIEAQSASVQHWSTRNPTSPRMTA